jgi:ATP-dependent RNA helicase RhlE
MSQTSKFSGLGLSAPALASLARAGYEQPTPIQLQAIPLALAGRDLVGSAATGTGKTAAFVLPIIERLAGKHGTRALILAPTRELANQIGEHLERFGQPRGLRGAVIIGGVGMQPQVRQLRAGHEVIIATPGRLIDHLDQGTARLNDIEILVLDEADRMLDMGFKPQLERILARLPKARQSMLFSATMAGEVAEFARRHLTSPERIEVARSGTVAERAVQRVFSVAESEKTALLLALLAKDQESTLVFTRTKRRADRVCKAVTRAGHKAARIHADRSQGQRRSALEGFKDGSYRVLVATDIAARGIDIEEIGHVILFDLPHVPEDYVHRVGRTARASASGRATSFCAEDERPLLRDIERLIRHSLPTAEVPRGSPVFLEELARRAHDQRVPGPRALQPGARQRQGARPLGRHARTHPKRPKVHGESIGERPSAGPGAQGAPHRHRAGLAAEDKRSTPARRVGSWRPRRHR